MRTSHFLRGNRVKKTSRAGIDRLERRLLLATVNVSGTAQWTDWQGHTHGVPLAQVDIDKNVVEIEPLTLATCTTDASGNFHASFTFNAPGTISFFARIFARDPGAQVQSTAKDDSTTYFMDTTDKTASGDANVVLPTRIASPTVTAEESFSIMSAAYEAALYATSLSAPIGGGMPERINVVYPANDGGFYSTLGLIHILKTTDPTTHAVTGDDGLDWSVIGHEYGHYEADRYSFSGTTSKGYSHSFLVPIPKPDGPIASWNEGFATFFMVMAEQSLGAQPYAPTTPDVGHAGYFNPTTNQLYNLATGTGVGELDEASVGSTLYHLVQGDQGFKIDDKTLFKDLLVSTPKTMGAFWDGLAANMPGDQRWKLGNVLSNQKISPVELAPADSFTPAAGAILTFRWSRSGSNDFVVQFFSSDFKTILFTSADLGDVDNYTPTAADWAKIFSGHGTVKWVVEGKNTTAPETPGAVPDQTYTGQTLDRYWSGARSLSGPGIAMVIDLTGSMDNEISAVQGALDSYISNLQSSLAPGESPPTIELVTFVDAPTEVISSNDLTAVKAAVDAMTAGGGGDIPEPSAASLEYAAQNIGPGGTILLITDAPSDPGSDLDYTIADLRAKGVTVNADITGDSGFDTEPTDTTVPTDSIFTEPPQSPVPLVDQTATDDFGNTPADATPLVVDDPITTGVVGNTVQDPTGAAGATVTDTDDYFVVHLNAGTSYNIPVLTNGNENVTATLFDRDGTTVLQTATTIVGDLNIGSLTLTFAPTVTGDYFLDINQPDTVVSYTVQVSDHPLVGATSSYTLYSTVAAATGGTFIFKDAISQSPTTDQLTDYQSSILNVMDSTFEPTVLTATPNLLPQGQTLDVDVAGRGTNWIQNSTTVSFSNPAIHVNSVTVTSPTALTVNVTIDPTAATGFSNITATTTLGASPEHATGSNSVEVTAAPVGPTLLQVEPSTLSLGETTTVTVLGSGTAWDSTAALSLGPGVTVSSVTVISATKLTAQVQVDSGAQLGFRIATVTTTAGADDTLDRAISIQSTSLATIASITSITPSQVNIGQHADVTVVGSNTNFVAGTTTASFGDGVTIDSVDVTDATHAVVHLDVAADATPGFRDVTLTTGSETAALLNGFLALPVLSVSVAPPSSQITPPLPFQPAVFAPFTVTLAAAQPANVTVDFATTDGTAIAGTDYTTTSGTLTFVAGQTSAVIDVPIIAQSTTQSAKTFTLTLSNPSTGVMLGTTQAAATIAAITVNSIAFSAKSKLTYTDSLGVPVTVVLHGPGAGTAYFVNGSTDPADIAVDGSTAHSGLVITTPKKSPATIGGIGINGSLGGFVAPHVMLDGNSAVSGHISNVLIAGNTGAGDLFQINGTGAPVRFVIGHADGLSIMSAYPIAGINALSWTDLGNTAGTITAPKLGGVHSTGDFAASLNIAGVLGPVNVGGQITAGSWTIGGKAASIHAAHGILAGWFAQVTGNLGPVVASSLAGTLSAAKIASVGVRTDLTANLTATTIGPISVGGAISGAHIRADDLIASVRTGSITDSIVFAGLSDSANALPNAASNFSNPAASIISFATRIPDGFSNTLIAAPTIRAMNIHGGTPTNAGGVSAVHYRSLVFRQPGEKGVVFSNRKVGAVVPSLIGTDFQIDVPT